MLINEKDSEMLDPNHPMVTKFEIFKPISEYIINPFFLKKTRKNPHPYRKFENPEFFKRKETHGDIGTRSLIQIKNNTGCRNPCYKKDHYGFCRKVFGCNL